MRASLGFFFFFPDVRRPVVSTAIDRERKKEKKAGVLVLVRSLCVFLPPGLARGVKRSLGFGNWGCGVVRFSSSIFVSFFFWVCLLVFFSPRSCCRDLRIPN
jgi:hypothetical protein